jgi:hypothetical protein
MKIRGYIGFFSNRGYWNELYLEYSTFKTKTETGKIIFHWYTREVDDLKSSDNYYPISYIRDNKKYHLKGTVKNTVSNFFDTFDMSTWEMFIYRFQEMGIKKEMFEELQEMAVLYKLSKEDNIGCMNYSFQLQEWIKQLDSLPPGATLIGDEDED